MFFFVCLVCFVFVFVFVGDCVFVCFFCVQFRKAQYLYQGFHCNTGCLQEIYWHILNDCSVVIVNILDFDSYFCSDSCSKIKAVCKSKEVS